VFRIRQKCRTFETSGGEDLGKDQDRKKQECNQIYLKRSKMSIPDPKEGNGKKTGKKKKKWAQGLGIDGVRGFREPISRKKTLKVRP